MAVEALVRDLYVNSMCGEYMLQLKPEATSRGSD